MTQIDEIINKLQTPEGKMQATLRFSGDSVDIGLIQSSMSRAQYFMDVARAHEIVGDKKEAKINYKQAMLSYEKAGVFSYAQNVAKILSDTKMTQIYSTLNEIWNLIHLAFVYTNEKFTKILFVQYISKHS